MFNRVSLVALVGFAGSLGTAHAATISKSIDVDAPAAKVWAMIGPFCSIKDWHPAIGQCTEKNDVRTLTTKDGKGQFVEKQMGRTKMGYSYEIEKSPLPITGYKSTLKVVPKGADKSTVSWSSTFTPNPGKATDADASIAGIYQAGLDNIQKMAAAK